MTVIKKLWVGIGILALLSPLGLLVPKWFGAGGAWGEWGLDEIEKAAGFIPEGMKRIGGLWKAPMSDYAVPATDKGLLVESFGYLFSAMIGIALVAGVMYIMAKLLSGKDGKN